MTLQTQVARPQLAATRGLSWTDAKLEHRLVCQRTRKLLTKQQKETETPGRVTLDHRSEPAGPLWGLRPRRRTTFPLTCSTSLLNCKWINRAADTERTRQRETEGHWVRILIFFLMTIPATHSSPNRQPSTESVCCCVRVCLGYWCSDLLYMVVKQQTRDSVTKSQSKYN